MCWVSTRLHQTRFNQDGLGLALAKLRHTRPRRTLNMAEFATPMDSNIISEFNTIKFYRFLHKILDELFINKYV
jgi:hypothetical protein